MPDRRRGRPLGWFSAPYRHGLQIVGATASSVEDAADPLAIPRAVRRALADAGVKATEVARLIVADSVTDGDAAAFARTALGPHGADVEITLLTTPIVVDDAVADIPGSLVVVVLGDRAGCIALVGRTAADGAGQSSVK